MGRQTNICSYKLSSFVKNVHTPPALVTGSNFYNSTNLGSTGIGTPMIPVPFPMPTNWPTSPDHAPAATTHTENLMFRFSPSGRVICQGLKKETIKNIDL